MRWLIGLIVGVVAVGGLAGVAAEESSPSKAFKYDAGGHRDPFAPLILNGRLMGAGARSPRDLSKPTLHGILWDPIGRSIALIDDTEVRVGDTVRGYRVAAIRQDEVVLEGDGQSVVLQIAFETQPSGTTTGGGHP
ncbi:MAG: hypothetical protein HY598_02365 [Candidatus Omnitrophica bacterium]|nr:hypothetical protein [Candidatus Omnitrophota bacterium]